jgi:hypothetical protein
VGRITSRWYYCGAKRRRRGAEKPSLASVDPHKLLIKQGILALRIVVALLLCWLSGEAATAAGLELRVSAPTPVSIAVEVMDEFGRAVPGAVVSVQLPMAGPTGHFANGLQSEIIVADGQGRALLGGITWDPAVAQVPVRVNASKDGIRAATVFEWRRPDPATPVVARAAGADAPDLQVPVYRGGGGWGRRMWWIAAAAGGAVAGGVALRASRGSPGAAQGPGGTTSGGLTTPPPGGLAIGAPIITVGRP